MLWQRARLGVVAAVAVAGCTTSAREVREARQSGYMTDFAVVYGAALAATKEIYPTLNESPTTQLIATAWHPLNLATGTVSDSQTSLNSNSSSSAGSTGQRTRYFVRFRVYVVGGKPFRVRIEGEASEWTAGEIPSPLKGAEVPPWLRARTDALRVAIHRRLKDFAVPIVAEKPKAKPIATPKLPDTKTFGAVPKEAADRIARIVQAAEARNVDSLREHVDADVLWAHESRGVDSALAIWAADASVLGALVDALNAGCAENAAEVVCPAEATSSTFAGYIARLRLVGGVWKLTSFFAE